MARNTPQFPEFPALDTETILFSLGRAGLTNEEIAEVFGVSVHQFQDLLNKFPDLREVLERGKTEPNFQVEQALYKRALGYKIREVTQEDGKPVKVVLKEIAPDRIRCIFWLTNRDPKRWRDVIEMKFSLRDRADQAHEALSSPNRKLLPDKGGQSEG